MSASLPAHCPACASAGAGPAGNKRGFEILECLSCRSLFVDPLPPPDDAAMLYADAYASVASPPRVVVESLDHLAAGAERFRREGRWLDLGFGDGALLDVVARRGWSAHGTEVAPHALAHGRARGWVVGDRLDERFPGGGFDVVSLVELVEHVPDATPFLRDAFDALRPGGLLYLTTPNARSLSARVLGTAWSVVSPPDHVVLFSAKALRLRLERAGFRIVRFRAHGLNPAELRARGRPAETFHRQDAAVALAESLSSSPLRRAFKRAANAVLSATGLGDTLKVWAVRP